MESSPARSRGAAWAACCGVVILGAGALPSCTPTTDDRDIQWVSVTDSQSLTQPKGFSLARQKSMVYVDPRSETAFAAGHIPGAILVPFGDLRTGAAAPLAEYDVLIVYDTDYEDVVARALSKRLIEEDRWDVYTLTGGLKAWEKAGNEVAYGMPDHATTGEDEGVSAEAVPKPKYGRSKR